MPSRRAALLSATLAAASAAKAMVLNLPITFRETYSVVEFSLGDPAATFAFQLDTGSATSWVIDSNCGSGCRPYTGAYNRTTYNFYGSHSANGTGIWGYIDYLGGYASGPGVRDMWSIPRSSITGGSTQNASNSSFEWEQTFMAISSSTMTYGPASGLMGLAFSSIADAGASTVVETLMWDGLLDENKFALYYGTEANDTIFAGDTVAHNGVLTIGSSREDEFVEGDMTTVPIEKLNGQYQVWRTGLFGAKGSRTVKNGTEERSFEQNGAWAVFDTGSGRMTAPSSVISDLYASIGMNWTAIINGETIPRCRDFNNSWSVTLELGLQDGEHVELELTGDLFVEPGFAYQEDACWPPFDPGDVEGFWLIGEPFLHKVYSVWDFGGRNVSEYEPTVSFGRLKEEYEPTEMRKFQ